jgi:hypothetical protein
VVKEQKKIRRYPMSDISRKALINRIKSRIGAVSMNPASEFIKGKKEAYDQVLIDIESFPSKESEGEATRLRTVLEKIATSKTGLASTLKQMAVEAISSHREDVGKEVLYKREPTFLMPPDCGTPDEDVSGYVPRCPSCEEKLNELAQYPHCHKCGQKLSWIPEPSDREDAETQKVQERVEFELQLLRMWQTAGIYEVYKYKHRVKAYHEQRHNNKLFYDLTNGTLFIDIKDVADGHPSIPYHEITPEDCKVSIESLIQTRLRVFPSTAREDAETEVQPPRGVWIPVNDEPIFEGHI